MSKEVESEFLDARPETARHEQAKAAAQDALMGGGEAPAEDDDLVFFDAAADSGLDIQVIAPPRKGTKRQPAAGSGSDSGAAPSTKSTPRSTSSSGSHRALRTSSGRSGAQAAEWERRARTMEEQQAAFAKLREGAQRTPELDPYLGRELGPFKIEGFLGLERGQRSYLGLDIETQDPVYVRVWPLKGSYADEFKALVERGERVCRVQSPSLSVCISAGRTKECFFTGHELPMGSTLEELLASGETFSEDEVFELIEQVAMGLKVLHARQLVHGDVSPRTIRREKAGVYVLMDAGLGRCQPELDFLSAGGEVVGQPGYVAPEEVDAGQSSSNGDIYALGCVAWTILAGRPPFEGADGVQVLLDQLNNEVPDLTGVEGVQVSEQGATIIGKLTGYTINTRYRSISDLVGDLRSRQKGESIKPFPSELKDPNEDLELKEKPVNAGTFLLILLLLLDVALIGAVVLSWAKTSQIRLEDPVTGYELPLPGVSEGGYGKADPGVPAPDAEFQGE